MWIDLSALAAERDALARARAVYDAERMFHAGFVEHHAGAMRQYVDRVAVCDGRLAAIDIEIARGSAHLAGEAA